MRTSRTASLSGRKIKTIVELKHLIPRLKKEGKKIVFTNGCFDILHYGHVRYLEQAKTKGDILIVAVNSDSSVRKIKGKSRPVINEHDRASVLAGLESVDFVTLFKETTPLNAIQKICPDVLIKGADWKKNKIIGADFVKSRNGSVVTIKFETGRSTSKIINKIAKTLDK